MRRIHPALPLLTALVFTACSKSTSASAGASSGPALPPGVTAQMVAEGDSIFNKTTPQITPCARCHGPRGVGAQNGPSLVAGPWLHSTGAYDEIVATITNGVPRAQVKDPSHQLGMNARGGPMRLTDPQIRSIAAYIYSISRAKTKG
jgi:mono/diheme cytochrome c family protein